MEALQVTESWFPVSTAELADPSTVSSAPFSFLNKNLNLFMLPADSGSDEDFLMEDDDDSDYGSSKKKNKKVSKKSKPERKEKKMPKPRLKATGECMQRKLFPLL